MLATHPRIAWVQQIRGNRILNAGDWALPIGSRLSHLGIQEIIGFASRSQNEETVSAATREGVRN